MSDNASTNDETPAEENEQVGENKPTGRFARMFQRDPLLPEAGAGGAPLTAVIAVISFLAVLAMAAALIINKSTNEWTAELRSEVTVQIKGSDSVEISTRANAALRAINEVDGVNSATLMSQDETAALLEPWLGEGNASAFLTVPALIEVEVNAELRNNLQPLRIAIAQAAPGAGIDDHASWHDRLSSAAQSGQALAITVFLLVMGAACAISIFAARAGLAANHEIVSVLHLVGATDDFIAAEVQRRFFVLGLRGSITGLIFAVGALALVGVALQSRGGAEMFLPQTTLSGLTLLWLVAVPVITCLVTAYTARLTVLRTLQEQY